MRKPTTTVRAAFLKPGMRVKGAGYITFVRTYTITSDGEFDPYQTVLIRFGWNGQYQADPDEEFTVYVEEAG